MYLMGDEAEKFEIRSFEEFWNNSEIVHFGETPLLTIHQSNNVGRKSVIVHAYRDLMESPENVDMLFYYTDVYSEDYRFFGCAITANNLSVDDEFMYDTQIAVYSVPFNQPLPEIASILSNSIMNERKMEVDNLVMNDAVFKLLRTYTDRSSTDPQLRWHASLILLVPYTEDLPGKKAWDGYLKLITSEGPNQVDRELIKSIKENKTEQVSMPNLEPIKPREEGVDYILISQTVVAVLIAVMVFYLIIKVKQELDEWKGEDEHE
jgi:hypothetical protein